MHIQINLHMYKVSSRPLFSIYIHVFCSIQWFCLRTVKALIRLRRYILAWCGPYHYTSGILVWQKVCRGVYSFYFLFSVCSYVHRFVFRYLYQGFTSKLNFNRCPVLNLDMHCLCKQCRSRSVGFWRSQLIWIYTVFHSVCEFVSSAWIK